MRFEEALLKREPIRSPFVDDRTVSCAHRSTGLDEKGKSGEDEDEKTDLVIVISWPLSPPNGANGPHSNPTRLPTGRSSASSAAPARAPDGSGRSRRKAIPTAPDEKTSCGLRKSVCGRPVMNGVCAALRPIWGWGECQGGRVSSGAVGETGIEREREGGGRVNKGVKREGE